jgi:hypothetical protein
MPDYSYNKIKPKPAKSDNKEVQKFTENTRRALEEIYKVIKKLVDNKADS